MDSLKSRIKRLWNFRWQIPYVGVVLWHRLFQTAISKAFFRDSKKARIRVFFQEIEYIDLQTLWVERIIAEGIDENEAKNWATEIGHVIEEYESSLMRLADLLQETDAQRIPIRIHSWAVGRLVVSIPEIEDPMRRLIDQLEKYLPPEPDDEDDQSS